jgi:hypothetical protein
MDIAPVDMNPSRMTGQRAQQSLYHPVIALKPVAQKDRSRSWSGPRRHYHYRQRQKTCPVWLRQEGGIPAQDRTCNLPGSPFLPAGSVRIATYCLCGIRHFDLYDLGTDFMDEGMQFIVPGFLHQFDCLPDAGERLSPAVTMTDCPRYLNAAGDIARVLRFEDDGVLHDYIRTLAGFIMFLVAMKGIPEKQRKKRRSPLIAVLSLPLALAP